MKINQLPADIAASAGTPGGPKAASGTPAARGAVSEAGVAVPRPQAAAVAPAPPAPSAANIATVKITVSSQARALGPISAGDGVDATRVAEVSKAIASGTYKVDAETIAEKMLANAQEILSRVRR
jgi:negative regulator of flagellin synthesis FlgM